MQELTKSLHFKLENLADLWMNGDLSTRVDIQFALTPEGFRWSSDNGFLNKGNPQLFQAHKGVVGDWGISGGR
jgi:hypothetical protein